MNCKNEPLTPSPRFKRVIKEFDYKDYPENGTVGIRPSVRAIIIRGNRLAMVYSEKYDYYVFAGGGINENETYEEALIREIREEMGLEVIRESIKEYGTVVRKERGKYDDCFIQENHYYLCNVTDNVLHQKLEDYEAEEMYTQKWVTAEEAIDVNSTHDHSRQENQRYCERLMERENWLLRRLLEEGLLECPKIP